MDDVGVGQVSGYVDIPVDLTSGWHSFAVSLQASTSTLQVLVDKVAYPAGANIAWTDWSPASRFGGGFMGLWQFSGTFAAGTGPNAPPNFTFVSPTNFSFTEFAPTISAYACWMSFDDPFFDLTDTGNQDLIAGPGNTFISWGAQGELITGTQPPCFFNTRFGSAGVNLGTGDQGATSGPCLNFFPPPA
jgi:hypothetical protein